MSYACTAFAVMLASPSDVDNERLTARDVIHEWNAIHSQHRHIVLLPVGWDTHATPALGKRPQELINEQVLEQCDLLVAMFWTRLGSPTGKAASGTVEEIQAHLDAGKPAMIYFSNVPVRPDSVEDEQWKALQDFKTWCKSKGLVEEYSSLGEFRTKFTRQLAQTVLQDKTFAAGDESVDSPTTDPETYGPPPSPRPELSEEAETILLEAAEDRSGAVLKIVYMGGFYVQVNGKKLGEEGTARSRAEWEGAIDQLCALGLLQERGHKGEVFALTADGFRVADEIRQSGAS